MRSQLLRRESEKQSAKRLLWPILRSCQIAIGMAAASYDAPGIHGQGGGQGTAELSAANAPATHRRDCRGDRRRRRLCLPYPCERTLMTTIGWSALRRFCLQNSLLRCQRAIIESEKPASRIQLADLRASRAYDFNTSSPGPMPAPTGGSEVQKSLYLATLQAFPGDRSMRRLRFPPRDLQVIHGATCVS